MYTDNQLISPKQAIKYLRQPGNAYVNARITPDDVFKVEVKKSYLIELFSEFDSDEKVAYMTFNDGTDYPGMLFDAYGLL